MPGAEWTTFLWALWLLSRGKFCHNVRLSICWSCSSAGWSSAGPSQDVKNEQELTSNTERTPHILHCQMRQQKRRMAHGGQTNRPVHIWQGTDSKLGLYSPALDTSGACSVPGKSGSPTPITTCIIYFCQVSPVKLVSVPGCSLSFV